MATISANAMFNADTSQYLAPYRHHHPECFRQGFLRRQKMRFYRGQVIHVAVSDERDSWWDGNEGILGFITAFVKGEEQTVGRGVLELLLLTLEDRWSLLSRSDRSSSLLRWREFARNLKSSKPFTDLGHYVEIDFLAINPDYQRKGIGSALVRSIQEIGRALELPIVLVASEMGGPMYSRSGFNKYGPRYVGSFHLGEVMRWNPPG
jgi:ribosomal protein S18 acetylase RimI-like enzyme